MATTTSISDISLDPQVIRYQMIYNNVSFQRLGQKIRVAKSTSIFPGSQQISGIRNILGVSKHSYWKQASDITHNGNSELIRSKFESCPRTFFGNFHENMPLTLISYILGFVLYEKIRQQPILMTAVIYNIFNNNNNNNNN